MTKEHGNAIGSTGGDGSDDQKLDITNLMETCASSLTLEKPFLCNEASFSLHDAMAATELMDRKMDSCQIPLTHYLPAETGAAADNVKVVFPRPAPKRLDDEFSPLPWDNLSVREAAFISTELLVRFQSFLSGASVGESIFTCLYTHDAVLSDMKSRLFADKPLTAGFEGPSTSNYTQFIVFAIVLAVVEATDMVRSIVINADIYEEEDFSPNTYDIPFYPDDDTEVDVLQVLEKALTMTKELDKNGELEVTIISPILGFLFGFLSTCTTLGKMTNEALEKELRGVQSICRMAADRLDQLVKPIEDAEFEEDVLLKTIHLKVCDSFVNRPLVGNTPVRKPFFKSLSDSVGILRGITAELDWAVCDLLLRGSSLGRIRRMLDRVQRSHVNVLSRSLIILNLYFDEKLLGQHSLTHMIWGNMRQWTSIPETLVASEHSQAFVNRLAKPIYDTLKLLILNRCRQRSYIEAVMINDWVTLQSEAHMVDVNYQRENGIQDDTPLYFSQYVLVTLLRIMDHHIALGIEHGLFYGSSNATFAFWYRDFILSGLLNNLSDMKRRSSAAKKQATKQRQEKGRSKKNKHKAKHTASPETVDKDSTEDNEDEFELMLLSAKRDLCRGLKRFIACLKQADVLKDRELMFTSLERVFEERFEVFQLIPQPPPLTYRDFQLGSDYSEIPQQDLLATTAESFQASKQVVDHLLQGVSSLNQQYAPLQEAEIRSLLKVCVGNNVYLLKLRSVIGSGEEASAKARLEFERWSQFCTVKLT